jgi:acyl-CoA dehydrogenase
MDEHIYPNELLYHRQVAEGDRWAHVELLDKLAIAAKAAGLWNLFARTPITAPG